MSPSEEPCAWFPYRFDVRYAPLWAPLAAWPGRDGVTLTNEGFSATLGFLKLDTTRDNVIGGHVTEGYRWYKAIGARLSRVDDGLTFGTNADRGVCIHFRDRVSRVIGFSPHSALTVTVADCAGLVRAIGEITPQTSSGSAGSDG